MESRDREKERELNEQLPIIPHEFFGRDCCGCIVAKVENGKATFLCNECLTPISELDFQRILHETSEQSQATAACPHCGQVNMFPLFSKILAYTCDYCGQGVGLEDV